MTTLREARTDRHMSLDDAAYEARRRLGTKVTDEKIRRLEEGEVSADRADIALVIALADVYDEPVEELAPDLAGRVRNVIDLVLRMAERRDADASRTPPPNHGYHAFYLPVALARAG